MLSAKIINTMKRGIFTSVVLSAFAVGFVSNAHAVYSSPSWFDADIESYESWPSDGSDTNIVDQGTWSGTANATLTHYLQRQGLIQQGSECSFLQGEKMGRPSVVETLLRPDGIVYVGGECRIVAKGELLV